MEAARAGDQTAFGELVRELNDPVWRMAMYFAGDPGTAGDVAHATWLRAYRELPGWRRGSPPLRWVLEIVGRVAANWPVVEPSGIPAAVWEFPDDTVQSFVLTQVVGLSYRDAGVVLGLDVEAVRRHVFEARQASITAGPG